MSPRLTASYRDGFAAPVYLVLVSVICVGQLAGAGEKAGAKDAAELTAMEQRPRGIGTLGIGGTEDELQGSVELLLPLSYRDDHLLFLYPEVTGTADANRASASASVLENC